MTWKVYLSGEIHTDWRQKIKLGVQEVGLPVSFSGPVLDHEASDECGSVLLGTETDPFWRDNKGASINAIRTRKAIKESDLVVVSDPRIVCGKIGRGVRQEPPFRARRIVQVFDAAVDVIALIPCAAVARCA